MIPYDPRMAQAVRDLHTTLGALGWEELMIEELDYYKSHSSIEFRIKMSGNYFVDLQMRETEAGLTTYFIGMWASDQHEPTFTCREPGPWEDARQNVPCGLVVAFRQTQDCVA